MASVSSFPFESVTFVTVSLSDGKILFPFLGLNFFLDKDMSNYLSMVIIDDAYNNDDKDDNIYEIKNA